MGKRYRQMRSSRRARWRGQGRRGGIEPPVKPVGRCSGCLGDIYRGEPTLVRGDDVYCGSACLVRGRHWVDPSLCGGCHGEHRLGVRPDG